MKVAPAQVERAVPRADVEPDHPGGEAQRPVQQRTATGLDRDPPRAARHREVDAEIGDRVLPCHDPTHVTWQPHGSGDAGHHNDGGSGASARAMLEQGRDRGIDGASSAATVAR
jgi:hypothetical protein